MDHRAAEEFVKYRIANTTVNEYPFPHFVIENIFPTDYYMQILQNWPGSDRFTSIADTPRTSGDSYKERHIVNLPKLGIEPNWQGKEFWESFSEWFLGDRFLTFLVSHYMPWIKSSRHLEEEIEVASDGLLVQDHDGYGIGPHTDAPHRLVSTLFYCPATGDDADLGTSLYVPTDGAGIDLKISPKHFDRRLFSKIYTAPYIPNCLFGFVVSPNSFHGVDKIERPTIRRNAILHFAKLQRGGVSGY